MRIILRTELFQFENSLDTIPSKTGTGHFLKNGTWNGYFFIENKIEERKRNPIMLEIELDFCCFDSLVLRVKKKIKKNCKSK